MGQADECETPPPCGTRSCEGATRYLRSLGIAASQAHPGVREAVEAFDSDDLFVSVLSVGEIAKGIALLEESRKRRTLLAWLDTLQSSYGDRLLAVDRETSRIWGEITAAARRPAEPSGQRRAIAATARS